MRLYLSRASLPATGSPVSTPERAGWGLRAVARALKDGTASDDYTVYARPVPSGSHLPRSPPLFTIRYFDVVFGTW